MKFTDSHCHLDFSEFTVSEHFFTALLAQCSSQNIHQIIVPSVSPSNWKTVLDLSKSPTQHTIRIHAGLGIHPWYLCHNNKQLTAHSLTKLAEICHQNKEVLCAIGETGIDSIIAQQHDNLYQQIEFFSFQLTLANQLNKPVIIHHRKSHQHIIPLIKRHKPNKQGVLHAFSGSYQEAKQYLDLGFKLGVGGTITYPRAKKTIETIKKLPLESIILETDAPSMPLNGYQGENNSPLRVIDVFHALCSFRPEKKDQIAETIEDNVHQLFFTDSVSNIT